MDVQLVTMFGLLFAAVATATGTAVWWLTDPQATMRRLSQVTGTGPVSDRFESVVGDAPSALARRARSVVPKSTCSAAARR